MNNMKKSIITLIMFVFLTPCGAQSHQDRKDYAVISGKVDFFTSYGKLKLLHNNKLLKEIPIEDDGSFRDTISVTSKDHTYYLEHLVLLPLYIDNQTNIKIFFSDVPSEITVSGTQAKQTQYLIERERFFKEKISNSYNTLFRQEPQEFKKNIRMRFDELKTKLKSYNFDNEFFKNQQNWIEYNYIYALIVYKNHIDKEEHLPKDFYAERDAIDFDNAQEFESNEAYRDLLKYKYFEQINENLNSPEQIEDFIKLINTLKSDNIRAYFAENLAFLIRPGNIKNKRILDFVFQNVKDKKVRQEIQENYNKVAKITVRKPASIFVNYENARGGTTSLTDLRGKRLYVNVWVTWFLPCKKELEAFEGLQEKLKGENIEFVSISMDEDKQAWREMVEKKRLKGVQLIADEASKIQFAKDYGIITLPTFLIIDEKGRIENLNAPHPSDPEIEKILKGRK